MAALAHLWSTRGHAAARIASSTVVPRELTALSRQPLPELRDTARRYEAAVRAVARSPAELNEHLDVMEAFIKTDGAAPQHELRSLLESGARLPELPASPQHLRYHQRVPMETTPPTRVVPFATKIQEFVDPMELANENTPSDPRPTLQCYAAAFAVHGMLRNAQSLLRGGVDEDDVVEASQLFGFSRRPLLVDAGSGDGEYTAVDEHRVAPLAESMGHVVVMHHGAMFKVLTRDQNGGYYKPRELAKAFRSIVLRTTTSGMGAAHPTSSQIGALTCGDRAAWVQARAALEASHVSHAGNLETIDKAFLVVCLDSEPWGQSASAALRAVAVGGVAHAEAGSNRRFAPGGADTAANRWYDKHMLVADPSPAARVGLHLAFPHAVNAEDALWARYAKALLSSLSKDEAQAARSRGTLPALPPAAPNAVLASAAELRWSVGGPSCPVALACKAALDDARREANDIKIATADVCFDANALAATHISPDAFVQTALHLAFHRTFGWVAPSHESSSSVRAFDGGRAESIRTASVPIKLLCTDGLLRDAGAASTASSDALQGLARLLTVASNTHHQLVKEASTGAAIDRHLHALEAVARSVPDVDAARTFFADPLFVHAGTWRLCTANMSQPFVDRICVLPSAADGYGAGYSIRAKTGDIQLTLAATKEIAETVGDFGCAVQDAAADLNAVARAAAQ